MGRHTWDASLVFGSRSGIATRTQASWIAHDRRIPRLADDHDFDNILSGAFAKVAINMLTQAGHLWIRLFFAVAAASAIATRNKLWHKFPEAVRHNVPARQENFPFTTQAPETPPKPHVLSAARNTRFRFE